MISERQVRRCLARSWGLAGASVRAHRGGMNSATWLVEQDGGRWVAKAVPPDAAPALAAGLAVAARVEDGGVPAGRAVPTGAGRPVVAVGGVGLALLTWVAGGPLTGASAAEQELIGRTLARVHRILAGVTVAGADLFHWIDIGAPHLSARPWLRPAVSAAVAAYERLDPASLTWGLLHADPAPEAFRYDPDTGVCGLIDWPAALAGPLVYDVASAVMYVGGPRRAAALLRAYLRERVLTVEEVDRTLPVMLRLRWAVQADYFARRIVALDLTGIADPGENEKGLAHARRSLVDAVEPGRTDGPDGRHRPIAW